MVEIKNSDDLNAWLEDRPHEDAIVIAARAALRVLPLLASALDKDAKNRRATILLPSFRVTAAPWVALVGATQGAEVWKAADDADDAPAAAYTAPASAIASAASASAWEAVSADAAALERGQSQEKVALTPLWPAQPPDWAVDAWIKLEDHLLKSNEGWEVWTSWYQDRLEGRPFNKALEEARVLIDQDLWDQGPKAVNAEIKRLISLVDETGEDIDFFISYNARDEEYARWAARVLYNNDYSVCAQFTAMPPGSNFVLEMDKGLSKAGRTIAILSPDYLESKACRAEWASAFNQDRDGADRKLIPVMVRLCEPTGLLSQIVYRRLVGLSSEEAGKALLDAIGHNQLFDTIPEHWPGDTPEAESEITSAVSDAMPQGRRVDIDPTSGKVAAKPLEKRPVAPMAISNEAVLDNLCRKIRQRVARFSGASNSDQYVSLHPILDTLIDAATNGFNEPIWLHDAVDESIREIDDMCRVGNLPKVSEAPELAALRRDLRNGLADLWRVYPALKEMASNRRTAHARPLTGDELQALGRAIDAFEEIVDERLQAELRKDAAAVRDAEPVELGPDLSLPEGELKDRLYRLAGMFVRVYRLAKTPANRLRQIFDQGVDVAKRIKEYEKAAAALGPIWRSLRDWLLDFIS